MKDLIDDLNYDNTFLCTYNYLDDEYMSLSCYQIQLLQALNMKLYNDDILQDKIKIIYEILKNNREIENILDILSKKIYNNNNIVQLFHDNNENIDNFFVFQLLFSQDYFHVFHNKFSKYINLLKTESSNNNNNNNHFIDLHNFILKTK